MMKSDHSSSLVLSPAIKAALFPAEIRLLGLIFLREAFTVTQVERRTDLFDVQFKGVMKDGCAFEAWLPLWAIKSLLLWTAPAIAACTDYEEMAIDGDWSAVRDSSKESKWIIFDLYLRESAMSGKPIHKSVRHP